jgi:hypothetical protein
MGVVASLVRPLPALAVPDRRRLAVVGHVAVAIQLGHFLEEWLTGFPVAFPAAFGLPPIGVQAFVAVNVAALLVWLVALRTVPRGARGLEWTLWFLAIAMIGNGVAHPALALRQGGYFPGLVTSIVEIVAGLGLLRVLVTLSRVRSSS